MMKFVSNKGGGSPVDIETAILNGYAPDGGLYVPEDLPQISKVQLEAWKDLPYKELAFEILSLFIDRSIVSAEALNSIIDKAYDTFEKEEVIPIHKLKSRKNAYIMELFYGSTLSFKDVGMSFLVNLIDFFLERKQKKLSIIVATTGDTGPAAASYIAGKSTLDAWVLYPKGMITEEQERQMTTLHHSNVHPVGVYNCPEGGDDLDAVIKKLYANEAFKEKVNLSSVNSLNWGRIMIQMVHYFYGYFQVCNKIGEEVNMAVPSGGFGNLCAGGLTRRMGLPVKRLIIANNRNECLHRIFSKGVFTMAPIHETVSSAIDILVPINFWRYLYFCVDRNAQKLKQWMEQFEETGRVEFDGRTFDAYREGFISGSVSDEETTAVIKNVYEAEGYLLDPHAAVSLAVAHTLKEEIGEGKIIFFATAHPAKFPKIIQESLGCETLPAAAFHPSIEKAKWQCQKGYTADKSHLEDALLDAMGNHWEANKNG
jgi:threonine synthase